ncbi:Pancreatic triacylglycerol lipase-like protein [Argiope bruennichi]|uniref:Pancreatic triacylglycerol lipase-like protein n=2 Tax=Argiope bruennichi TaxID=94029 RepID=A0A8T0FKI6_ARGBR|nr:Pancreatic triacylglycerol lipase-like protein [Argiope bruennichi]
MRTRGINMRVFKFLLVFFIIVDNIFFSFGACCYGAKDLKYGIPAGCYSDCNEMFAKPNNNICSVSYLLYTGDNIDSPCYVEPKNEEFDHCAFDPGIETKILIHGYSTKLSPGNVFDRIKNSLLSIDPYNVIIVNWTNYNQGIYKHAVENAYLTGIEVGKFINYLTNEKGQAATSIHVIGHSLGAHVAGVAGKRVPDLGRISGLDPAAPLYKLNVTYNRLTGSDALFVDVIHCSNGVIADGGVGYGIPYPIGNINFYPNGGINQPACVLGRDYATADLEVKKIKSNDDLISCRHDICPIYFWYSIQDCVFLSRECYNYKRYNMEECFSESHPVDVMGLYAKDIPNIPNHSKFYLNTTADPPYCLENCD